MQLHEHMANALISHPSCLINTTRTKRVKPTRSVCVSAARGHCLMFFTKENNIMVIDPRAHTSLRL